MCFSSWTLALPQDLSDSRRINSNVQSVPNNATPLKRRGRLVDTSTLSATVVSQLFWPALPTEDFTPVPAVAAMLETYGHKYHSLKAPRKLQWKHSLGTVALELTIGAHALEFNVRRGSMRGGAREESGGTPAAWRGGAGVMLYLAMATI